MYALILTTLLGTNNPTHTIYDDIRGPAPGDRCVLACDVESDTCMSQTGNDGDRAKQCDNQYQECLLKCVQEAEESRES